MVSTVTWTSYSTPSSLVSVGSEAVCMLCDNILCFTDLKTKATTYYKAESPELGLSIKVMAGHHKFSFVAFAEVVLMPSVHIIQYPQFTKYAVFKTQKIISFVDIRFNDFDLLLALSGYPFYTICIWNFRTGNLMAQLDTLKECETKSILCSFQDTPLIVQFSQWNSEILAWGLCHSQTGLDLREVSKIKLSKDFAYSNISSMCFGEDNNFYVVDHFAKVFRLEVAQFCLKLQWRVKDPKEIGLKLKRFSIESHKQGLLVYRKEIVYYLHRNRNDWQCEWKLKVTHPPGGLLKCISNSNGDIYASADVGNLYQIENLDGTINVNPFKTRHENNIDFVILKGVKEECLLQLTVSYSVKAVALLRYNQYSSIDISEANTIAAHNIGPYIMVGTSSGNIHFLNYSNVKQPLIVAKIETENSCPVGSLHILDKMAVYKSNYNDFYLIEADFSQNIFRKIASFESFGENVGIEQCFLAENNRIFIFINRDSSILIPHTNVLCCYQWQPGNNLIERLEFNLPTIYRDVGILTAPVRNIVEFFAVRMESSILDYLNFKPDTNELVIVHSLKTNHLGHINGIVSSINFLTWGVDGTYLHSRTHRKSPRPYGICQNLQIKYRPRVVKKVMDCFNGKYFVYMYARGGIKIMRVATMGVLTVQNVQIAGPPIVLEPVILTTHIIEKAVENDALVYSPQELRARETLLKDVQPLAQKLTELINYEIEMTGKSAGVYKKYCLNHKWLSKLREEAKKLCQVERDSIERVIVEQSKIRDWIYFRITNSNKGITYKLRAIFSYFSLENFGMRKEDKFPALFDLYRFYDLDAMEIEGAEEEDEELKGAEEKTEFKEKMAKKKLTYLNVQGNVYDHTVCNEFAMQDVDIVTCNLMYNQDCKIRVTITDLLRIDFNKKFEEIRQVKFELLATILATNNTLNKIYSNKNCMLKLLGQPEFEPPILSVPEWEKDEFAKNLLEVDDSEIKAVNRRKKKIEAGEKKQGRLLLWSLDFWMRALIAMMDGVLEKLWEEEIKKDIPVPEFLTKKDPSNFTLEDQKALKEYKLKCHLLEEDRKKYLRILTESERNTLNLKENYIFKLNENVTALMITKLKYDFAMQHVRLRNFVIKCNYFRKLEWLNKINSLRAKIESLTEYIQKYTKLHEFWAQAVEYLQVKVETLNAKQKVLERHFRSQYLSSIPRHCQPDVNKLFKRRPKLSNKLYNSTFICKGLSTRVNTKSPPKYPFPLPREVYEYLKALDGSDHISNMPETLDVKYWDQLVKLRRHKIEMELRIKAASLQLSNGVLGMNTFSNELENLKNMKVEETRQLYQFQDEYLKSVQDQYLELRLTMGQVEYNISGSLKRLENCVLIGQDDINDINATILKAGQAKIKSMQKVAIFRRRVIYREWEHKVLSSNIEYMKYMIRVIEKCNVSIEFLELLRNWKKAQADKLKMTNNMALLQNITEKKLVGYRKQITRINQKIASTRLQVDEMKKANKRINRQIFQCKTTIVFFNSRRDYMMEAKRERELNEKMEKIKRHNMLIDTVRRDYVHIMELKTLLELQRLRTYPQLGPNSNDCSS